MFYFVEWGKLVILAYFDDVTGRPVIPPFKCDKRASVVRGMNNGFNSRKFGFYLANSLQYTFNQSIGISGTPQNVTRATFDVALSSVMVSTSLLAV